MRSLLLSTSLVTAVGVLAAATAATAAPPDRPEPVATAAGADAGPLVFPSLVGLRLQRTQTLLDRAQRFADEGQPDKALVSLASSRANLRAAWDGAKYVIENAPPPVAEADAFHRASFRPSGRIRVVLRRSQRGKKVKNRTARAAQTPAGPPSATIYDTGFAVLALQHAVATTAVGLIDEAGGTLLDGVSRTVFTALNERDETVAYIKALPVPPPVAEAGSVTAHQAQEEAVVTWATVMPGVVPYIEDELQQIDATQGIPGIRAGATRVLAAAEVQDIRTERRINLTWPPLPVGD